MGRRNASPSKKKKNHARTVKFHLYGGDETPRPLAMIFGTLADLVNVINSTFGTDRFTGFRSVKGRKRPFAILKCP